MAKGTIRAVYDTIRAVNRLQRVKYGILLHRNHDNYRKGIGVKKSKEAYIRIIDRTVRQNINTNDMEGKGNEKA